jgi:hypothetical protein
VLSKHSLTYNLAMLDSKPNDFITDLNNYNTNIKGDKEEDEVNSSNRHSFEDFYSKQDG